MNKDIDLLPDERIERDLALYEKRRNSRQEYVDWENAADIRYGTALREVQQWRKECTPEKHHAECDTCLNQEVEVQQLREALQTIREGKGRFSRDPLEHASNTIEDMKEIADRALEGANDD